MGLIFTEEQEAFRQSLRSYLREKSPESEVRRLMATDRGYDEVVWQQLASELGVQGLAIPEEHGGSGFSLVEVGIALEEAGRALLCAPFLSSVIASTTLLLSEDDRACKQLLPGIASGETLATVALTEVSGSWDADSITCAAAPYDEGWHLSGSKSFVLDGLIADVLLVFARTPDGVGLFAVDGTANGVTRSALTTLDETRKLAHIDLQAATAQLIGTIDPDAKLYTRSLEAAAIALANEQAGVAERCMEMSVEYAGGRIQFGRPIGSFQAIKHKCADLLVAVESAKSAAYVAAAAFAEQSEDVEELAALAASFCSEAALFVGHETIQIHGAIAFTWEYPVHLYYKRAKSSELMFGDTAFHRERLARVIGL